MDFLLRTLLILLLVCTVKTEERVWAQVSQSDSLQTVKVHFLYGSKPRKEFKFLEKKYFGGLHGGHVSIELGNAVVGFEPHGRFHVFGSQNHFHSQFRAKNILEWMDDSSGMKYTSISIRLTPAQYQHLCAIHESYMQLPPYDYAFIGMRCAAATYEILGQIGIMPQRRRHFMVMRYFYPKLLRKRMLKLAIARNYFVHRKPGRTTRKWEKDSLPTSPKRDQ